MSNLTSDAASKSMQYGGAMGTALGATWTWIGENAIPLGLAFTAVSMICTVLGTVWIIKHKKIQMELDRVKIQYYKNNRDYE